METQAVLNNKAEALSSPNPQYSFSHQLSHHTGGVATCKLLIQRTPGVPLPSSLLTTSL